MGYSRQNDGQRNGMIDTKIKSSPATNFPIFIEELDTYRRRYKSSAAGAFHNIVGIESSKEP
jgi:hypothetical protein